MFRMNSQQKTIAEFLDLYDKATIDMSPRYQRTGGIWKKKDNQLLIDSIFNGIDLPKFYFHLFPSGGDKWYQYAVIDGKQRLLAIRDFYNNQYQLSKDFRFWKNDNINISGMYYRDISENYPFLAGTFLQFKLDITLIDTDDMDIINDIFIRINKGEKVTPAEQRNAYGGALIDQIAATCERSCFFKNTLTFKDERKAYQELFLKLFVLEQKGEIVTLGDKYINTVLGQHKDCSFNDQAIITRINYTLEWIASLFEKPDRIFRKNNVILYYWFFKDKLDKGQEIAATLFIKQFEERRIRANQIDLDVQRFNELTRQGTYQGQKLKERLEILEKKYYEWGFV